MQARRVPGLELGKQIRKAFDYRSGRVIATCRAMLALSFVLAVWIDPNQPVRINRAGELLVSGYVALSLALLVVAWRSWWYDHVLAGPALLIDIGVFLAAVFYTENQGSDFVSPFLSFFAFIMLASNSRWGWRTTAWLALFVASAFLIIGLEMHRFGLPVNVPRFSRRLIYMAIMSLVLVWFGSQNMGVRAPRFEAVPDDQQMLLSDILAFVAGATGASQVALAWSDAEEPRLNLLTLGMDESSLRSYPNDSVNLERPTQVTIYDALRRRELVLTPNSRVKARATQLLPGLNRLAPMDQGLCVPLVGSSGVGQLLLGGIKGLNADHLRVGMEVGREIALAMDRHQLSQITSEAAMIRMRGSIARDLHDSVAQSLAGASFRIAALRTLVRGGGDPLPELDALYEALMDEQNHVRAIISRLRQNEIMPGDRDLAHELAITVSQLERQWGIEVTFPDRARTTSIPAIMVFEIQQLVREGVANAVRHGQARRVEVGLSRGPHALVLTLDDNGHGFTMDEQIVAPRSLAERVGELGGTLVISSHPGATRLGITLPLRGRT